MAKKTPRKFQPAFPLLFPGTSALGMPEMNIVLGLQARVVLAGMVAGAVWDRMKARAPGGDRRPDAVDDLVRESLALADEIIRANQEDVERDLGPAPPAPPRLITT